MNDSISGKTAVVTGSSSGIGKAIATTFGDDGANVVVCALESERENLAEVERSINRSGAGRAVSVGFDVTDRPSIEALREEAVDAFGGIDILVNNAGGATVSPFRDLDETLWNDVVDLNLGGTFNCTHVLVDEIVDGGGGSIVNIASAAGVDGAPNNSPYAVAKAGIINLTKTLAFEFAPFDVRVNAVAPGTIATDRLRDRYRTEHDIRTPRPEEIDRRTVARRFGTPQEIADMVHVLASPAASYVTGHTMSVGGVPRLERLYDVDYYGERETPDYGWVHPGTRFAEDGD